MKLISTIYVLDASKNEWSGLVSNLAKNSTHEDTDIQRSAVLTLGYICEKLATNTIKPSEEDIESIMTGVATGLMDEQKNENIRLTAIKALQDSIPLFKDELQKENVREFFLTLILKNAAHSNQEISLKATQSLIDIIKSCYQYLSLKYMNVILERTVGLMKHSSTSIVIASTEFWNSMAHYELHQKEKIELGERSTPYHGFISSYGPQITTALLENLMKKDSEDDDSGLSVHAASLDCLINVNTLASGTNKDINIGFISSQIGSDQDKGKVAALMCFEAMILGYTDDINNLIDSSFSNIVEFLRINATVCRAALKVIRAISDRYPSYMLHDKVVNIWLELLVKILHSELKLASYVCTILGSKLLTYFRSSKCCVQQRPPARRIHIQESRYLQSFGGSCLLQCFRKFVIHHQRLLRCLHEHLQRHAQHPELKFTAGVLQQMLGEHALHAEGSQAGSQRWSTGGHYGRRI